MHQPHPDFIEPNDPETTIWHYRPLWKFESILKNQALFFATIRNLQSMDSDEGNFPPANETAYLHAVETSISTQSLDPDEADGMRSATQKMYDTWTSSDELPYLVANCWHINESESEEMWKEYVGEDGNGVAIRTTFSRLKESFDNAEKKLFYSNDKEIPVHAGIVHYLDRDRQWIPYDPFSWKLVLHKERRKFHKEQELRVAADLSPYRFGLPFQYREIFPISDVPDLLKMLDDKPGVFIPVNLNALIETVILSPTGPPELHRKVERALRDNDVKTEVVSSGLSK